MTIAGKMAIITRMHSRSVKLACGRRGAANRCRTMIDPSRPRLASSLVIGEISREYIAIDQTGNYSFPPAPSSTGTSTKIRIGSPEIPED